MKKRILLFLIFLAYNAISQELFFKEIEHFRKFEIDSIKTNSNYSHQTNKMLKWRKHFLNEFDIYNKELEKIETINFYDTSLIGQFLYKINLGNYLFYRYENKNIQAQKIYREALELAITNNNRQLICEALKRILDINRYSYLEENNNYSYYLDLYKKNTYDIIEDTYLDYYSLIFKFQFYNNYWEYDTEKKLLKFVEKSNFFFLNGKILQLIGSHYHKIGNDKKAVHYEKQALENIKKIKHNYASTLKKIILISLTRYNLFNEKHKETSQRLKETNYSLQRNKLEKQYLKYKYFYSAYLDSIKGNYKSAFINYGKYISLSEDQDMIENKNQFKELQTKYQIEKKEKENLQLKQKNLISETNRKQNANLFYGALIFLLFGGTTAILVLNNSHKKRQLAEQEKELEQKKNDILRKEQELNAINAMVEGQEKERKRIAEDLHDNVGSVLATLKLHFENLKLNREKKQFNQEELYIKTEELIDETYAKIRHIAHEKNAGVIANQGLLVAIQIMANKISAANKTYIEVIDFGLEKRLENSLEIAVFRIIQELTTNILKHAEAKNASINISLYKEELNIIIEDDGIGFDAQKVDYKNGMGINSIKTRIEHLNGTFDIDSSIGKGTSIIINIPTI